MSSRINQRRVGIRSRTIATWSAGVAIVVALAAAASGCGSTSGDTGGTASGNAASPSLAACAAEAATQVQKYSTPPQNLTVSSLPTPLKSLDLNASIAYISATSEIAYYSTVYSGFSDAAKQIGANVHLYDPGTTIPNVLQAINTAIAAHSSVIVLVGYELENLTVGIANANSAHIPIVSGYQEPKDPKNPPQMADVKYVAPYTPGEEAGERAAWFAMSKTGCKTELGDIVNGKGNSQRASDGIKALFAKWCPDTCHQYTANVPATAAPTQVGAAAVSLAAAHPEMQYVWSLLAGDAQQVIQSLKSAGYLGRVQVVMAGATPWDAANIQVEGNGYAAEMASQPVPSVGWKIMDGALRTLGGGQGTLPMDLALVVNSSQYAAHPFPAYENDKYQQVYLTAWGAK